MKIDSITNGIVIDHITAGKAMQIYDMLGLDKLDCSVALLRNVSSGKMGRKDIIKIDEVIDINFEVLGYVSPNITVDIIRDGVVQEKKHLALPQELHNILHCKNPRCITTTEQDIEHIFRLSPTQGVYRCIYCDTKA